MVSLDTTADKETQWVKDDARVRVMFRREIESSDLGKLPMGEATVRLASVLADQPGRVRALRQATGANYRQGV